MKKTRLQPLASGCFLLLLAAGPLPASSAEENAPDAGLGGMIFARHMLSVGGTRQKTDASIGASADGSDPVAISLDDLGIDARDSSYYLEYRYRFSEHWSLFAGGYSYAGSGGGTVDRDFSYDGVEFTVGSSVKAGLDIDAYILSAMYKVYRSEEFEFLLGGGVHALDLGASIAGNVRLNEFESEFRESRTTLLAPVPNFRVAASWAATKRLGFTFVGGWLSANVDEYDGAFTYGHVRALLRVGRKSAIGFGYQITDVDITESRDRGELIYDLRLTGPTLSFSHAF